MRKILMGMAMLFLAYAANSQSQPVTGKVTDEKGTAVPQATIIEKGTKNGTFAKDDGTFSIKVKPGAVLVISALGFETKEVAASSASTVSLKTDTRSLSEVVVTGTGSATSKKKLGITVEAVTAEKLPAAPTASVDQALVGKIPGAQISTVSGFPGAPVSIVLRGINSLQAGTNPMILLDGVELKGVNLNSIDLSTIERVEVVEGAASAGIYGAQGANGVIQLFSKKGKQGKVNIDFSSSISRNTYLNVGHVHKAYFHSYVTDGDNNVLDDSGNILTQDSVTGQYSGNVVWNSTDPTVINNKPYNRNLKYYDHFKEFFVPANTTNNTISISGAKDKSDFFVSASNSYQEINFLNDGYYSRSNFIANIGTELAKNLKFRSITQAIYTRNSTISDQGFIYELNNTRPFANYFYKTTDGNYAKKYGNAAGQNGSNPNYDIEYIHPIENKVDIVQTFDASYKFPKFVDLDVKYGLNYENDPSKTRYDNQTSNNWSNATDGWDGNYNGIDATGEIDNYANDQLTQNLNALANVHLDFQRDFGLKLPIRSITTGGFDWRHDQSHNYWTYTVGLPSYQPVTAAEGESYGVGYDYTSIFVTYGYLVHERLEWGEIAGIEGGFRTDYSSAFGSGHSPFTFPSYNGYFRVSQLPFWLHSKISSVINEFKIHAAEGKAGVQPFPFDRYITLSTANLGTNNAFYFGSQQPNPALNVEVSEEKEIGADFGFNVSNGSWFKTINARATWWKHTSSNTIWSVDVAPSTGVGTQKGNSFSLGSNGYLFGVDANILTTRNFTWDFTTNFNHATSKIISTDGPPVVLTASAGSTGYALTAGEKIGQLYGYMVLHSVDQIDPNTKQPFIDKADQANYSVASNGIVVNTANKSPFVSANTYSLGDPNPKFNVSFIDQFTFKGCLTLGFQFDWIYGSHIYNQTKEWMYRDGISGDYDKAISIGGGTPEAWTAFYRGMYANTSRDGTKSYFYEDASFLRLRNVALAFDFAKAFNMKTFRKLQLVLSGRNLWTVTKYTGFDPEISSASTTGNSGSAWDRGTDHNTLPNYKSYQIGLNVGF